MKLFWAHVYTLCDGSLPVSELSLSKKGPNPCGPLSATPSPAAIKRKSTENLLLPTTRQTIDPFLSKKSEQTEESFFGMCPLWHRLSSHRQRSREGMNEITRFSLARQLFVQHASYHGLDGKRRLETFELAHATRVPGGVS